jgi:acetyl esterase/lipase
VVRNARWEQQDIFIIYSSQLRLLIHTYFLAFEGGFFAHTIASDVPYLLDWSAATGAVVIVCEYALLPEFHFPVALQQITDVYSALVQGNAVSQLGFQVNRIVVTGESAGGNLAAALCVKIGMQLLDQQAKTPYDPKEEEHPTRQTTLGSTNEESTSTDATRMPAAMMLSCAALNLSLELSHSRVIGTQDPVLPSGLISAISDAYLPNISKQDPLASPFFAPDSVLRLFPPTLLFASSTDPLLDDSVHFNKRLRCLGVNSELRAAQNMPHAYWGLGTAGFPEAQQVQQECCEWLVTQFASS